MSHGTRLAATAALLHSAARALNAHDPHDDTIIDRIHTAMAGHPTAARWDTTRTAGTPWCWTHQRDLALCHRDGHNCLADDIVGTNDPAGDLAARQTADRAADDLHHLDRLTRRLHDDAHALADILERWPAPRPATAHERTLAADNTPGCESCARVKRSDGQPMWGEPIRNGSGNPWRTDLHGTLPKPMLICQACRSHVIGYGQLPPKRELANLAAGKKRSCQCTPRRDVWTAESA